VLIVSVEEDAPTPLTGTGLGENEQMGGIVTTGEIELHESVTPGAFGAVLYPLIGLMSITATPLLPAGTLAGAVAFSTVIVNCGVTASTVM
jgi:hypothetical protein